VKSEIAGDEPLSDYARAYLNERARNNFYDYVLRRFQEAAEKHQLTKAQLARRIGLGPDRITKVLGSPGNWTLDTITELLVGICREEIVPHSRPYLNRAAHNFRMEDFLQSLPSVSSEAQRSPANKNSALGGSSALDAAKNIQSGQQKNSANSHV
jgi:DNA-binding phage protein